jgi:hypothetical protein
MSFIFLRDGAQVQHCSTHANPTRFEDDKELLFQCYMHLPQNIGFASTVSITQIWNASQGWRPWCTAWRCWRTGELRNPSPTSARAGTTTNTRVPESTELELNQPRYIAAQILDVQRKADESGNRSAEVRWLSSRPKYVREDYNDQNIGLTIGAARSSKLVRSVTLSSR